MSFLLDNLFALIYWLAILGGMAWWLWIIYRMRRGAAPPKRTDVENGELARLQTQLTQRRGESDNDTPTR